MKAVTRIFYGAPDVIEVKEIDNLQPHRNEVLVKVYATTINRTDCAILQAKPDIMRFTTGWITPNNKILGTDFAGIVEAVGNDITAFKVGDRVWGFDDNGLSSQAEYLCIEEQKAIFKIPKDLSYAEAAASAEGAHYAYNFLNKVTIKPHHKVLINGATGAIGSALLQFVSYFGATITATCRGEHAELIKALGADKTINYIKDDFTLINGKFDFIFDTVGKSTYFKCRPILEAGGTYISSELGSYAQNIFLSIAAPFFNKKVKFPLPVNIKASLAFTSKLIEAGKYHPLIDNFFGIDQAKEAYTYVLTGKKVGNVVLKVHMQ